MGAYHDFGVVMNVHDYFEISATIVVRYENVCEFFGSKLTGTASTVCCYSLLPMFITERDC